MKCVHMEQLEAALKARGIECRSWVYQEKPIWQAHLRFKTERDHVSVIWGFKIDRNGKMYGITHGWPKELEAVSITETEDYFRCNGEPEAMTVQEIIEKHLGGMNESNC